MIHRSFSSTATFIPRHPIALRNCDRSKLYALPFAELASSGVMSEFSSNAAACLAHFSTRRLASSFTSAKAPLTSGRTLPVAKVCLIALEKGLLVSPSANLSSSFIDFLRYELNVLFCSRIVVADLCRHYPWYERVEFVRRSSVFLLEVATKNKLQAVIRKLLLIKCS